MGQGGYERRQDQVEKDVSEEIPPQGREVRDPSERVAIAEGESRLALGPEIIKPQGKEDNEQKKQLEVLGI